MHWLRRVWLLQKTYLLIGQVDRLRTVAVACRRPFDVIAVGVGDRHVGDIVGGDAQSGLACNDPGLARDSWRQLVIRRRIVEEGEMLDMIGM